MRRIQASISSTSPSATCFELNGIRAAAARRRGGRPAAARSSGASRRARFAWPAAAALLAAALGAPAAARVYVTQQQALARLFPAPAEVSRQTAYLSEAQAARVAELAGRPLEHRVVPYYVGRRDGRVVGYAFTDVHLVRTLPESVLFAVDPDGRIRSVEILSFDEPPEYLPGPRWLAQLEGRSLDESLSLKRDIRTLSGATLSSRAVTAAARRVLALFEVIVAGGATAAEGRP
jgi:Na+-translocating ferredoxin:NAD+ oxidoreductase RnfG subunit